jgi:hypothetical protein
MKRRLRSRAWRSSAAARAAASDAARPCAAHYFDDPTHVTVFDDANMTGWLARFGLRVVHLEPGLLPFSMNSRLPKSELLTALYLRSPLRPLAAQMYVVAEGA